MDPMTFPWVRPTVNSSQLNGPSASQTRLPYKWIFKLPITRPLWRYCQFSPNDYAEV